MKCKIIIVRLEEGLKIWYDNRECYKLGGISVKDSKITEEELKRQD